MMQRGFTIIELLIATLVFSVVTLVITTSVLQFTKQYYRGVVSSTTQSTARGIIDDISRSVQFNSDGIFKLYRGSQVRGICVGGSKRYNFEPYQQVGGNRHGLVSDTYNGCGTATSPLNLSGNSNLSTPNARELLGEKMQVAKLSVEPSGEMYTINVKIVYGDNDLLKNPGTPNVECKTGAGSQFCAVSELTTTVKRRVQ